jgi:ubiquinone/menaquinone biosynthesis C-methylase UbiE
MEANNMATVNQKAYKGMGMEGWIAKWYAATTHKDLAEFQSLAKTIAAELLSRGKILEVAPGPGFLAIELAKAGNFEVTGLDISKTFVEIARGNAAREGLRIDFRRGNAAAMPFESGSFDRVICRAAFKNFTQPVAALKEMRRVLKPGGKALVIDLRKDAPVASIDTYVDKLDLNFFSRAVTKWTFRSMLLPQAYSIGHFRELTRQSGFLKSDIAENEVGFEAWLEATPVWPRKKPLDSRPADMLNI